MAYNMYNRVDSNNNVVMADLTLMSLGARVSGEDSRRLARYREYWNFYEGYHWETIGDTGKQQVTENYCRAFVNKFTAFEFGHGFNIKMKPELEEDILPYLNFVWDDNSKEVLSTVLGQTKAVTGEAWIQVAFEPKMLDGGIPNPAFDDPYDEYEVGRVRLLVVQPNIVFPEYENSYDKDKLKKVTVMYPVKKYPNDPNSTELIIYKQIWDKEVCLEYLGSELVGQFPNRYGVIPFIQVKNFELAGRTYGISDLEDLIPLNMELNLKKSDISEIIDYHSAPITVVFGARVGQLEKGANKVWGGLPKDGRVENLSLNSDLSASNSYVADTKQAMHEVGGVPEGALGKETNISNTSGVALQVQLMPLIERVGEKQKASKTALAKVNKLILKILVVEGMLTIPEGTKPRDFYYNEIIFEDNLPKDRLVEIQQIQLEMKLGLCDREEGMKRLGKTDIQKRLNEIVADMKAVPFLYGLQLNDDGELEASGTKDTTMEKDLNENKAGKDAQVNAGLTNSPEKQQETNS